MTSNKPRDDLSICYLNECFSADFEEGTLTLSDIPHEINMRFQKLKKQNKSGVNGAYWSNKRRCWALHVTRREGIIRPYLTQSKDFFEAVCAKKSFELKNGFDKNRGIALDN